jgi:hypothetical protein
VLAVGPLHPLWAHGSMAVLGRTEHQCNCNTQTCVNGDQSESVPAVQTFAQRVTLTAWRHATSPEANSTVLSPPASTRQPLAVARQAGPWESVPTPNFRHDCCTIHCCSTRLPRCRVRHPRRHNAEVGPFLLPHSRSGAVPLRNGCNEALDLVPDSSGQLFMTATYMMRVID